MNSNLNVSLQKTQRGQSHPQVKRNRLNQQANHSSTALRQNSTYQQNQSQPRQMAVPSGVARHTSTPLVESQATSINHSRDISGSTNAMSMNRFVSLARKLTNLYSCFDDYFGFG